VDSRIVAAPATVPLLSAASFKRVAGMDPTKALTVSFNAFADASANGLIFFAVQDASGNTPIFDGFSLTSSATSSPPTRSRRDAILRISCSSTTSRSRRQQWRVLLDNRTMGSFSTQAVPSRRVR